MMIGMRRLEGSRWCLQRTRGAVGFESTLGWKCCFERSCVRSPLLIVVDILLTSLAMFTSS